MVLALWVRERSCAWTPGDLESGDDAMIATALIPLDLKNRNLEQTCNQSESSGTRSIRQRTMKRELRHNWSNAP